MITDIASAIEYLKGVYPNAEVFASTDKDFIVVRSIICASNFGKQILETGGIPKGKDILVNIYNTEHYHIDTIRLKELTETLI